MSIQLLGTNGYFTRLGAFIGEYNRVSALYGTALTVTGFQSIWSQYATSDQAAVVGLPAAQTSYQSSPNSYQSYLAGAAQISSQLQVNDNVPLNPYTYAQSIQNVIQQMISTSQYVNKPTITSTVATGLSITNTLNIGNPTFSTYTLNPYGVQSDTIYAETVTITCTSASVPYNETFQAVGVVAVPFTAYNWPQGSGTSTSITVTNPASTTLITDGVFNNWSGVGNNTPTNWIILNGSAGTQVLQGTSPIRSGYSYSASIVSDGTSATQLAQAVSLSPNTVYAFSVQAKMSSTDGAGIFRICLTNGSGTILTNDAGNNLSQTFTMSSATGSSSNVGSSYTTFTVFFATPKYLPSVVYIQYGFSTAPGSTKILSLDLAAGVAATQLYNQGPYVAAFSSSTADIIGDVYTATYTNSLGTQSFVRGCQRVLNFPNLGIKIYWPSSNSPTIPDSLVTNP
jgi:hypothetical protein